MRLPAEGAHLSPGPRSCCRRRCPCHPGWDAAAGWRLRTSGLMSCTRYVPHQARKARCPTAETTTRARIRDPSLLPAAHTFSGQLAVTLWAWDTLEGLEETVASSWRGQCRDQRLDGAWPDPRDAPIGCPGHDGRLGLGVQTTLGPYCAEFEPDTRLFRLGTDTARAEPWDLEQRGKSLRLSPRLDCPLQHRETHWVISQVAEGYGTRSAPAAGATRSRATSGPRPPDRPSWAGGVEVAARGRSRGASPSGVAPPPRPGVITRAPPPRRLPPPAGHNSGNPAQALPPGHTPRLT